MSDCPSATMPSFIRQLCHASIRTSLLFLAVGLVSFANLHAAAMTTRNTTASNFRGVQFIAFDKFTRFQQSRGSNPNETVLLTPEIQTRHEWDELIVSWNADTPPGTHLKIEARALYADRATKFYCLGLWSSDPAQHPRESVLRQRDADGDVNTDVLELNQAATRLQLRITLGAQGRVKPRLRFLSASMLDSRVKPAALPPNRAAWDKSLPVPERSQMAYAEGGAWCSPTTISMMLAHWGDRLRRPELDNDVPVVAAGVHDPVWGGTGNWVFNTAYAGSFTNLRAYTARLTDVAELEDWIAQGIPVGVSLCYNRLRARSRVPSGHLVVVVGFTETGDVIINDPGTRRNVQKIFPRAQLVDAWSYSKNAVYLVYPEGTKLPRDRFGHWDSATANRSPALKRARSD